MLDMYAKCKITATDLCTLCHWASIDHVPGGAFSLYELNPTNQSGKFQRHADSVLPSPGDLFMVSVPFNLSRRVNRVTKSIPVKALWRSVSQELALDAT